MEENSAPVKTSPKKSDECSCPRCEVDHWAVQELNNQEIVFSHEFELASECYISGVLREYIYRHHKVSIQLLTPTRRDKNDMLHYLLKIDGRGTTTALSSRKVYTSEHGLAGELIELLTLFFQCRFFILSVYCILDQNQKLKTPYEINYVQPDKKLHSQIFDDKPRNFSDPAFTEFLNLIQSCNDNKIDKFLESCRSYRLALEQVGVCRRTVYIRLITAIEVFLEDYGTPSSFKNKAFDDIFKDTKLNEEQFQELKDLLRVNNKGQMHPIVKISKKFVSLIKQYSEGYENIQSKDCETPLYVTNDNIDYVLDRIYNARSRNLHQAKPLLLSFQMREENDCYFDSTICSNKLPYEWWFEGLVRHCLMNYLNKNI